MTDSQIVQLLQELVATQQAVAFSTDRIATALEKTAPAGSETNTALGFTSNPAPIRVYVARTGKTCWYTLSESNEKIPLNEEAIAGTIKKIERKEIESEEWGDRAKCDLTLAADRNYLIRCGWETAFFKSLVLGLTRINPQDLKRPITIAATPGKKETVVLCQLYAAGMAVNTSWDEEKEHFDWSSLFQVAIRNLEFAIKECNDTTTAGHHQEGNSTSSIANCELRTANSSYTPSLLINNLATQEPSYSDRLKSAARRAGYSNYELRQIASKVLFREIETGADIETDAECIAVEQALLGNVRGIHDSDAIPY